MAQISIQRLTDAAGLVQDHALLARCAALHRQLRPMLPEDGERYAAKMQRVCQYGAAIAVAVEETGQPLGLALYRVYENTYENLRLYIDDLVTDEAHRSAGIGKRLLDWCAEEGRSRGCEFLVLDSGTWRTAAHKLYFREGFSISSFHFTRPLV
ncbi:GNAT family N-acetyltransferase [uncultured Aquitalea sp.]|uniref:GNAT family N-acetyltransferase n=1 Tax=uncultured Aquitalea sp. TaxID=540272 RepID=UPI0025D2E22B|nr:GNAT family N-acetyltransferase [uncultured Aquitalea sp.]